MEPAETKHLERAARFDLLFRVNYSCRRIASNQMLLNSGRTSLLANPATKLEMAGQHRLRLRRRTSANPIWASILPVPSPLLIPAVIRATAVT